MTVSPIPDRAHLTFKQAGVYDFLVKYYLSNDQLPATRATQAHFGWKSQTAAIHFLNALKKKGWLERNSSGGWRFVRPLASPAPRGELETLHYVEGGGVPPEPTQGGGEGQ